MGSLPQPWNDRNDVNPYDASSSNRRGIDSAVEAGSPAQTTSLNDPTFDILEWHPTYESCIKYFLDIAQHEPATQAVCALINIRLPFQAFSNPITSSNRDGGRFEFSANPQNRPNNGNGNETSNNNKAPVFVSPIPYLRRLVVTGFDKPAILHGFFGDAYNKGVMPHVECERRNYLFAAKHGGWRTCKRQYDVGSGQGNGDETLPFMKPLEDVGGEELAAAETAWSKWLAMEDWMVGKEQGHRASYEGGREGGIYNREAQAGSGARYADGGHSDVV